MSWFLAWNKNNFPKCLGFWSGTEFLSQDFLVFGLERIFSKEKRDWKNRELE